jgi:hypothetical protein
MASKLRTAIDHGGPNGDYTAKIWYRIKKGVITIEKIRTYKPKVK